MPIMRPRSLLLLPALLFPGVLLCRAAVDTAVTTHADLANSLVEGFYIVGFCDEQAGPRDCRVLQDLLAASDAALSSSGSSSMLQHVLLHHNTAHWRSVLHPTSPTHLWFGCHDGAGVQLSPLVPPHPSAEPSDSDSAAADTSWYLDPQLSAAQKLALLLKAAVKAAGEQGTACIRGQLQHAMTGSTAAAPRTTAPTTAAFRPGLQRQQQQQQQQQQQRGAASSIGQVLQKALNTCVLLLLVFAAGRFWPQLSSLFNAAATLSSNSASSSTSSSTSSSIQAAAAAAVAGKQPGPSAAAAGPYGLRAVPEQLLVSSPPSAPPSLPSAPTTPARLTTAALESGGLTVSTTSTGLNPGYFPSGLNPAGMGGHSSAQSAGGLLGLGSSSCAALSTAASVEQIQMDNAQLAELVSQLHTEVGGSKAAAADASAAVRRQQAATQEALSCLQDQLVELESRVSTVEEFGTAFNAAAAAAAVAQKQQQHHDDEEGPSSKFASCADSCSEGGTDTLPSSPFAASAPAPGAASSASKLVHSQQQQHDELHKAQPSKAAATGAAAAAAAAAAASAAATAAAAAARGGAATEAALQRLCDFLVRQGAAAVGAVEAVSAQLQQCKGAGSTADQAAARADLDGAVAAAAAVLGAVEGQLAGMKAATIAIAALSDELKGIRPPAPTPLPGSSSSSSGSSTKQGTAGMLTPAKSASPAGGGPEDSSCSSRSAVRALDFAGTPGSVNKPPSPPPVSPREADAAAATWAELQLRIKAGERRAAAAAASVASTAPKSSAAAASGAASMGRVGSDGWEELEAAEEGRDE